MSGFPDRPSRDGFGPTMADDGIITDPERFVGSDQFNLLFWQLAGCGLVVPRAWALLNWSGAALSLAASAEAFDPKGLYVPTPARSAVGTYSLTYASTYPDKDGTSTALSFIAGEGAVQALGNFRAVVVPNANPYVADIEVYDADAGTKSDQSVLVKLY